MALFAVFGTSFTGMVRYIFGQWIPSFQQLIYNKVPSPSLSPSFFWLWKGLVPYLRRTYPESPSHQYTTSQENEHTSLSAEQSIPAAPPTPTPSACQSAAQQQQ